MVIYHQTEPYFLLTVISASPNTPSAFPEIFFAQIVASKWLSVPRKMILYPFSGHLPWPVHWRSPVYSQHCIFRCKIFTKCHCFAAITCSRRAALCAGKNGLSMMVLIILISPFGWFVPGFGKSFPIMIHSARARNVLWVVAETT